MDSKNGGNLGEQIKKIVQDAVDSKDFTKLNQDIGRTVNMAVSNINATVNNLVGGNYKGRDNDRTYQNKYGQKYRFGNGGTVYEQNQANQRVNPVSGQTQGYGMIKPMNPIQVRPYGSVSGVVATVFGSIFTFIFSLAILVLGIVGSATGIYTVTNSIIIGLTPLLIGSIYGICKGSSLSNRAKRYKIYVNHLVHRQYCSIKELSTAVGKSEKYVLNDLRKMIRKGMFPQGHIDAEGTCFMLTNDIYQKYIEAEQSYIMRNSDNKEKENGEENPADSQLNKAMQEGKEYLAQIHRANTNLTGVEITRKLTRLEEIIERILKFVSTHPEQLPEIRKFMEYYVPTTLKLLKTYEEFESEPIQGVNIQSAKHEIMNTLDTINEAFIKLFDSLYEASAMEVSADISVLNTVLAQEGLAKDDFQEVINDNKKKWDL